MLPVPTVAHFVLPILQYPQRAVAVAPAVLPVPTILVTILVGYNTLTCGNSSTTQVVC